MPVGTLAGPDRFATAVAVSASAFPTGAPAVVIATGRRWPDALGGSALAGAVGGPVLLSEPGVLPPVVAAEIARLGARDAYVLGGEAALSAQVASDVAAVLAPGGGVTRLAGPNSYGTAEAVASATVGVLGGGYGGGAFFTTGAGFADAVACSASAARAGMPVLLVPPAGVTSSTLDLARSMGVTEAVVVGGTAAVDAASYALIEDAAGDSGHATRVAGQDRYRTALELATWSERLGLTWDRPAFVSGEAFPDALVAGVYQARAGSVLLTSPRAMTHPAIEDRMFAERARVSGLVFVGGTGALSAAARYGPYHGLMAPRFDDARAMAHVRALAGLGPRRAGSAAERAGADYIAAQLRSYGYAVSTPTFAIPGGTSRNVIAERAGTSGHVVVIGGHMDSHWRSPGGNDNASGVAVTLELARLFAQIDPEATIRFVAFGAEEISGDDPWDHHFGSHAYVNGLSSAQRTQHAGMISVDMVGYGTVFNVRSMLVGPTSMVVSLQKWGAKYGQPLPFLEDYGVWGWSDHEAFEFAGIPAAWVEWRTDPVYHTSRDTAAHVQQPKLRSTGYLLRGWVLEQDAADLDALR